MRTKIWLNSANCLDEIRHWQDSLLSQSLIKLLWIFFSTRPQTLAFCVCLPFPCFGKNLVILSRFRNPWYLIILNIWASLSCPTNPQVISNHPGLPPDRVLLDLFNQSPASTPLFPFSSSAPTELPTQSSFAPWLWTPHVSLPIRLFYHEVSFPYCRVPQWKFAFALLFWPALDFFDNTWGFSRLGGFVPDLDNRTGLIC